MSKYKEYNKNQLIEKIESLEKRLISFNDSEEKYRAMFEKAPLSYQSLNEDGNFIDVNPMWLKTMGYTKEEVIGKWFGDFLKPDYIEHFKKNFQEFKKKGAICDVQFYMQKKNGEEIYISLEGYVGYTPEGKFKQTYCIFKDITREYKVELLLKKNEDKLRRNEELLRITQEISNVGGWQYDVSENKMFWTKQTYLIHDMHPYEIKDGSPELIEKSLLCYDEKDRSVIYQAFQNCVKKGISYDMEFPLTTIKGHRIWIRTLAQAEKLNGKIVKVNGNIMDITSHKEFEQTLIKSEKKFRDVLENIQLISIMLDKNANITFINDYLLELTGWKRNEIIGKNWFEYFIPKDLTSDIKNVFKKTIEKGEVPHHNINEIVTKSGELRLIKWSNTVHLDLKNDFFAITSIGEDITEQNKAVDAIRESEEKFRNLVKSMSDLVFLFDERKRFIYYHSPKPDNLFTKSIDFIGKTYNDVLPAHLCELLDEAFEKLKNAQSADFEYNIEIRGKQQWYFVRLSSIIKEGKFSGAIAIISDITDRYQIREAVIKTANKWHTTFDSVKDMIFIIGSEGKILNCNSATSHFFGISKETASLKYIWEFLYNVDAKPDYCICDLVNKTRKRESQEIEIRNRWFEIIADPIFSDEGEFENIVLIVYDITERRKAFKTLEESETNFRLLADHNYDWEYWLNPRGDYAYISPACEKISGYPAEKFYANPDFLFEITHPDFREKIINHYKNEYEQHSEISTFEFRIIKANGDECWIEHVCKPVFDKQNNFLGRRGANRDITQRKHDELLQKIIYCISQAANTSEKIEKIIDLIRNQLQFIINVKNFYVAFYNEKDDSFSSPYMIDEKDNLTTWSAGKTLTAYVLKAGKSKLLTKDKILKLHKDGVVDITGTLPEVWLGIPLKIKENTYGIFALQNYDNKNAYNEGDLKMLEFVSHQIGISIERKRTERELQIAYEKSMESDRLKTVFLATMSHELRTPLNAVIGFSDLIEEKLEMNEILNYARIVKSSGYHLLEIIESIFDVSLLEVGHYNLVKKKQSIFLLMQSIHDWILDEQIKIESKLKIIYKPNSEENQLFLNTDKSKLKQILINLLRNALKFTHEGFIEFGYEKIKENDIYFIRFYVKDTGIGIAKDNKDIIFNIFRQVDETLKRSYGGTGVGLYIVKRYTEILGGTVDFESEEGKGSTFYITFPYNDSEEVIKNVKESDIIKKSFPISDKKILIVEDDEASTKLLIELVKNLNIKYIVVTNGKDAVEICSENPDIELVLMDIKIPNINGFEATKLIKKERPKLTIVAQTAYAILGDKETALKMGCDDYISKPIKKDKLERIIRNVFS